MTTDQIEAGKKWVQQTIMKLAAEYAVTIDNLEWRVSNKDFDRAMLSIAIFIKNERQIEKFSEENLSDCPKSPDVREELESRLRNLIRSKSSQSGNKIGF
jgi:hypothetical protein